MANVRILQAVQEVSHTVYQAVECGAGWYSANLSVPREGRRGCGEHHLGTLQGDVDRAGRAGVIFVDLYVTGLLSRCITLRRHETL